MLYNLDQYRKQKQKKLQEIQIDNIVRIPIFEKIISIDDKIYGVFESGKRVPLFSESED